MNNTTPFTKFDKFVYFYLVIFSIIFIIVGSILLVLAKQDGMKHNLKIKKEKGRELEDSEKCVYDKTRYDYRNDYRNDYRYRRSRYRSSRNRNEQVTKYNLSNCTEKIKNMYIAGLILVILCVLLLYAIFMKILVDIFNGKFTLTQILLLYIIF